MLIQALSDLIAENKLPVFRLAVYENGEEQLREFLTANDCNNVYSISKNFTAAAVGILFDRGLLRPETKVHTLLEPLNPTLWAGLDPRWYHVTVRHLLTQTTGHGKMFLGMDCDDIFQYGTEDFLQKVLTEPLVYAPGARFAYSDSNYYLLSRVVAAAAGEPLQTFAARELFTPLGVQGWAWSTCPQGHAMGGTRLFLRVTDLLHFGRMLLDGGVCQGKRILSESFVRAALTPQVEKGNGVFYGYSFWMRAGSEAFHCSGMHGQKLFVDPAEGRVVAWQALDKERKTELLTDYLYGL